VVAVLLRHVQWERNLIERNEALLPPRDPPMMVDDSIPTTSSTRR
jgi:hypothetical protein